MILRVAAAGSNILLPPAEVFEAATARAFQFDDFTLDRSRYRLERGGLQVRLERIPMELLLLLVERGGELVTRDEIAARLWRDGVFVDVDHSINTAIRKIRFALDDDPEQPRYVETVVGKGYRFAATVISVDGQRGARADTSRQKEALHDTAASVPQKASFGRLWLLLGAAVVLVAVSLVAVWRFVAAPKPALSPAGIKSLAVLPLKNLSGDASQEYLADGMTEALIGSLSGIHELRVISRTSVMRYKDSQLSAPQIAKQLGVDALVEGSVIRDGNRIRIHAQLIRAATDEHFWSETYDREMRDAISLESDVAQTIAEKVGVTVTGDERKRIARVRPVTPEVYETYLKGSYALNKSYEKADIATAISYFQRTIQQDPTFAPAYIGMADAYDELGSNFVGDPTETARQKEMEAAEKAIALDPSLAEPHVVLAEAEQREWRWADSETEYRRALELNPNNAYAHELYAFWLVCQGRIDEGLQWGRRARELDPDAVKATDIATLLTAARHYDEAIHELRTALASQPNDPVALWDLGIVLVQHDQPSDAIPILKRAVSLSDRSPGVTGMLVSAYGYAGRRSDALRLLGTLQSRRKAGYVPASAFVNSYLGLGERAQAFAWLEEAYREHSNILQFLKVSAAFDSLRGDPRFDDLLRRTGLN